MNRIPALLTTLALVGGAAAATASAAAPATAAAGSAATTISIDVKNPEPEVGDSVKIKGLAAHTPVGRKVTLQVKYADQKQWKKVATTRLTGTRSYKFTDKVSTVRARTYRVVLAASGNRPAVTSARSKVTVYGWRALTSLTPVAGAGMFEVDSVRMNGVTYQDAVLGQATVSGPGTPASIDYNLNRDCKAFEGQVGLSDSSPANGSAALTIAADGVQKYAGSFALTQSAPVALDLTKVFRVTVTTTPTNGGLGALGAAQVLCSF